MEDRTEIAFLDDSSYSGGQSSKSLNARLLAGSGRNSAVAPMQNLSDMSAATTAPGDALFDPIRIDVVNVSYTLGRGKRAKTILKGVDCSFVPGQLSAIMGPSGAGKTTLLNILAARRKGHTGEVNVIGKGTNSAQLRDVMSYVQQYDSLLATQTVRECLLFSAMLRLQGAGKMTHQVHLPPPPPTPSLPPSLSRQSPLYSSWLRRFLKAPCSFNRYRRACSPS